MWQTLSFEDKLKITGIAVTVILAFVGWIFTSTHARAVERRRDRLERVSRQLKDLFGPLYATLLASDMAWNAFRGRYRPGGSYWGRSPEPNDEEKEAWVLWMRHVFSPMNERIEELITTHADLLDEPMPQCFLEACAHVAAYRTVVARWDKGDFSQYISVNNFPSVQLRLFIEPRYFKLQAEQQKLIGKQQRASSRRLMQAAAEAAP